MRRFFFFAASTSFAPFLAIDPERLFDIHVLARLDDLIATGTWALGIVRFSTISIESSLSSSSTLQTLGMPNSSAFFFAASRSISAHAAISTIGKFFAMPRYAALMAPFR